MKTANETSADSIPQDVTPNKWWSVRPVLRSLLILECSTALVLYLAGTPHTAFFLQAIEWLKLAVNPVLNALPYLAGASVIAVFVEGHRSGRFPFRRANSAVAANSGKVQTAAA